MHLTLAEVNARIDKVPSRNRFLKRSIKDMASSPVIGDTLQTPVEHKGRYSSRAPLRKETLHSAQVWESKRDVIKELYMDQRKPLREVSRILEIQHNFIAR